MCGIFPKLRGTSWLEFQRWRQGFAELVKAHREASLQFREGDLGAEFRDGTSPCALPFVPFPENQMVRARGHPI